MALNVARSFNAMVTDTTQVRDVSEQMVLLEPDANPLYVITNAAKRKKQASHHGLSGWRIPKLPCGELRPLPRSLP